MFLGKVIGSVVSSTKHPCYQGLKLMLVRLTDPQGKPAETTWIVVDTVGAGPGDWVLVASEGLSAKEILGFEGMVPIREIILGVVDRVDWDRR